MARKQATGITTSQRAQVQGAPLAGQHLKCQVMWRYLLRFLLSEAILMTKLKLKAQLWKHKNGELAGNFIHLGTYHTHSWQVVSKIQKHTADYFQPAYFCSQEKRTSLTINSNHVQNRYSKLTLLIYLFSFLATQRILRSVRTSRV